MVNDPFGVRSEEVPEHPTLPTEIVVKIAELRKRSWSKLPETQYFPRINEILRGYQKVGVAHLVSIPRMVLGDDTGLGKTVMTIAAIAVLKAKGKIDRAMIFTHGSALLQWESEIKRFSKGLSVLTLGLQHRRTASLRDRIAALRKTDADIVIVPYSTLSPRGEGDLDQVPPRYTTRRAYERPKYKVEVALRDVLTQKSMVIFDEVTAVKNTKAKRSKMAYRISTDVQRVVGLTATLAKNDVMDVYGVYRVVFPKLFPSRKWFEDRFVVFSTFGALGRFPTGAKNLPYLRKVIDPVYLSRRKVEVAKELPSLQPVEVRFELHPTHQRVYRDVREDEILEKHGEEHLVTRLTAITFRQMASDDPRLLDRDAYPTKVRTLQELLESTFEGKKLVVFSRFKKMVDILEKELKDMGRPVLRVTGDESNAARDQAIRRFAEEDKPFVFLITEAGSEAINLQASDTLIFVDLPFSFGTYYQTIGRVHRIGSEADHVFIYHLLSSGTVDEKVYGVLRRKFELAQTVADVRAELFSDESTMHEIVKAVFEDEKS